MERLAIEEDTKMFKRMAQSPGCLPDEGRQRARFARPFTIADAMTLIAFSAIGIAVVRAYTFSVAQFELTAFTPFRKLWLTAYLYLIAVLPLPLVWSFAGLLLGLCRPRPLFRRVIRQPGFVACSAVSTVIAIRVIGFLAFWLRTALNNHYLFGLDYWEALPSR